MSVVINRAYRLRRRPVGGPVGEDLQLVSEELPPLGDGEALVRTRYLSLDPTAPQAAETTSVSPAQTPPISSSPT